MCLRASCLDSGKMAKKRKADATRLDEVDRSMYTTFCSAANSLSQLYSQAMSHQRLSFQAGERQALVRSFLPVSLPLVFFNRVSTQEIFSLCFSIRGFVWPFVWLLRK